MCQGLRFGLLVSSVMLLLLLRLGRDNIASAGTLAEEVISTVRTAHAFGTQPVLSDLYDTQVQQASVYDSKAAFAKGMPPSVFTVVLLS